VDKRYLSGMNYNYPPEPPVATPKKERARRPVAFHDFWEERIAQARELAAAGATDRDMAADFGIDIKTFYAWRAANPNFHAACKMGKEMPDARVEGVAFTLTQGFSYSEQQAIKVKTGEHTEAVEIVEVERFMPPDKTAVIFWLKNRLGWRDSYEAKVSGEIEHRHTIDADPRRLAIALLATLRKGIEAPVTIEGEPVDETDR
jgi:hypothetical protein